MATLLPPPRHLILPTAVTPDSTQVSVASCCTRGKKILLLFIMVQLLVIFVVQWRFGGILRFATSITTSSSNPAASRESAPVDFLGTNIDIHPEHPRLGHTWEGLEHDVAQAIDPRSVAVGLAITSMKLIGKVAIEKWPFFRTLMPTFCATASNNYSYHFFLAYDSVDRFFGDRTKLTDFSQRFHRFVNDHCPQTSSYSIHFIQCSHTGKPARAQNDAMMAAYMLNIAYYYRINDDTDMKTGGWTKIFIDTLQKYNPANVGVVGPNHKNGNTAILTYDFVYITHVDMFGFYYPHQFTDWWADSWISAVYKPGRVTKVSFSIPVAKFTMQFSLLIEHILQNYIYVKEDITALKTVHVKKKKWGEGAIC